MTYPFAGLLVRYRYRNDRIEYTATDDELHVNLWEVGSGCFMDVGVMIGDISNIISLHVDVPWQVNSTDISDLGSKLDGERSIAAIFNEIVRYRGAAGEAYSYVSLLGDDGRSVRDFRLLRLNGRHFQPKSYRLSTGNDVSNIRIRLPLSVPGDEGPEIARSYVRFRINNVPKEMYTAIFPQKDSTLLSSSTETRIIDFRINVRRGIPEELLSADGKLVFPSFSKIHCFLTTAREDECVFHSNAFSGCRSLVDEDIWNEYIRQNNRDAISEDKSVRNYLGYQWTVVAKKAEDESVKKRAKDLIVLARFSRKQSGAVQRLRFIFLGIVFGTVGSAIWEFLKPYLSRDSTPVEIQWGTLWFVAIVVILGLAVGLLLTNPMQRLKLKKRC